MKTDKKIENQAQEEHITENETEIELPTYKEVSDIIKKFKENKAQGTDNIPAELIKYAGYILKQRMYKLILLIWNKEQLPTEWLQGLFLQHTKTVNEPYAPTIERLCYLL